MEAKVELAMQNALLKTNYKFGGVVEVNASGGVDPESSPDTAIYKALYLSRKPDTGKIVGTRLMVPTKKTM